MIILPERGLVRTRVLPPIPEFQWRQSSQRTGLYQRENETRWVLTATRKRRVVWRGYFYDRNDADAFLLSALTGAIWLEPAIWRLPLPNWDPDIGVDVVYRFSTQVTLTTTSASNQTWTIASDWSAVNTVECFGNGGGGGNGNATPQAGGGAGGGAYAKSVNLTGLTPGGSATFRLQAGVAAATAGPDVWFNSTAFPAAGQACGAKGGGAGTTGGAGGTGGLAASCYTTGAGATSANGGSGFSGGANQGASGGGGCGGPNGAGANGGSGATTQQGGSGGGAADGGSSAANATSAQGTAGGAAFDSTAGGAAAVVSTSVATAGSHGSGGGAGSTGGTTTYANAAAGGAGVNYGTVGPGGGGGGAGINNTTTSGAGGGGGLYGGGGGGGGGASVGAVGAGGSGAQGLIVISYTTSLAWFGSQVEGKDYIFIIPRMVSH